MNHCLKDLVLAIIISIAMLHEPILMVIGFPRMYMVWYNCPYEITYNKQLFIHLLSQCLIIYYQLNLFPVNDITLWICNFEYIVFKFVVQGSAVIIILYLLQKAMIVKLYSKKAQQLLYPYVQKTNLKYIAEISIEYSYFFLRMVLQNLITFTLRFFTTEPSKIIFMHKQLILFEVN